MDKFPHLRLTQRIAGRARIFGGGSKSERSTENLENRGGHGGYLRTQSENLKSFWDTQSEIREANGLPPLDPDIYPILLRIDPAAFDVESAFANFNIEVISENEEGYILGTSFDGLRALDEKIRHFLEQIGRDKDQACKLWEIVDGHNWRPEYILSEKLLNEWENIVDGNDYTVDIGIACYIKVIEMPTDTSAPSYLRKLAEFHEQSRRQDEIFDERIDHLFNFLGDRIKEQVSDIINSNDSFSCRLVISGGGMKDLVLNYPYVFEVTEVYDIENINDGELDSFGDSDVAVIPPDDNSPRIVVIDSGIQENHRLIAPAIDTGSSISYLTGNSDTSDNVQNGGHGTKVAGAILYPVGVDGITGNYQLPFFIVNARILDDNKKMPQNLYPPELMEEIVDDSEGCRLFNLSVNSSVPCRTRHMSAWAASIDKLIHEKDVLFIVSAGNVISPDIRMHFANGERYPNYLLNLQNRIANPAQSSFCLAVGSINHNRFDDGFWQSLGEADDASPFSRTGFGLWGMIKPDVVEYGGGLVKSLTGNFLASRADVCPQLIRSTLHGGNFIGNDDVGTSFSAPKVSHIAGQLEKMYGDENVCLIRGLIIHGARLPKQMFLNPTIEDIRHFGYGIPSLSRVTTNSPHRITLYTTASIRAEEGHIYAVKVPTELRSPGNEFDVLVEVTLVYSAKTRRTRQKTKSYLATWLDWESSKKGERYAAFQAFAMKQIQGIDTNYDDEARRLLDTWDWKLGDRSNRGEIAGMRRNDSTAQKDWSIIKSHELPEELSFSVRGHRGWDNNREEVPYAFIISFEMINRELEIYETIRIENEIEIEI